MANWLEDKVVENRRINEYLSALIIDAPFSPFEAGQFVRVGLMVDGEVLARPYSLVNTPEEQYLEVYFNIVEEGPLSPRLFALSTRGTTPHTEPDYAKGDAFLFGPETRGLPDQILESQPTERRLRIPMRAESRSLNLSNAAAIVIYEAWRQLKFAGAR